MDSFIRELYESDISAVNKNFAFSEEGKIALQTRDKLHKKLEEILREEKGCLLQDYDDADHIVRDDELFHAYVSGIRDIVRFAVGAFTE